MSIVRIALFMLLLPLAALAQVDDPETDADAVQVLINSGEFRNAIARVEAALKKHKKHQRLQLQRGLILVQLERLKEAESHYKKLKRWFRDNPEPGNNLAMVYRYQGDYEDAIEEFQETIEEFPDYAQAHENLGDTYLEMAGNAYRRGSERIPDNAMLTSKVEIVSQFNLIAFNNTPEGKRRALTRDGADNSGEDNPQQVRSATDSESSVSAEGSSSEDTAVNAGTDPTGSPALPNPGSSDSAVASTRDQVMNTLNSWITTWSDRDVVNHLAHYSQQFDPGNGVPLEQWVGEKRVELSDAQYILINLTDIRISQTAANLVTVTFEQSYESDSRADRVLKSLTMGLGSGDWLILKEESRPLG